MKKQDFLIIALLFALWLAWPFIDREIIRKYFFPRPPAPAEQAAETAPPAAAAEPTAAGAKAEALAAPSEKPAAAPAPTAPEKPAVEEVASTEPEKTAVLESEQLKITVSSRGATLKSAVLKEYRETLDPASGPVVLNFDPNPALAYAGLEGLSGREDFAMDAAPDGKSVRFERTAASGLRLRRTISLADGYLLKISDELANGTDAAIALPVASIGLGSMRNLEGEKPTAGMVDLGVDTLSPGGEGVKHWGSKVPKWFEEQQKERQSAKLPVAIDWPMDKPVDWVGAKNKYFAQVLVPEGGGERCAVAASRAVTPAEAADPNFRPKAAEVAAISASIQFPEMSVKAGETFARPLQLYIGPKKYSELSRYGLHLADVMEFGMWAPIGKLLLLMMNGIYKYLWPHNYGIAIMLLTVIIRIVFWPITHKSTESMKRMQELQPLMKEIREKYKDQPQKMNTEMMALYKEHKVNPLSGCLPTLIQIPVFIALFVVLRSAIELRFAPFLWVKDLSQPENLLAGVLPIPLNILPIFMAAATVWQTKLTPSSGADPNQQKMMMFMPVLMLVMFYNFAAGLVLYWSTNTVLVIVQQLMMQRRKSKVQSPTSKV